jgi:hypothetical protein
VVKSVRVDYKISLKVAIYYCNWQIIMARDMGYFNTSSSIRPIVFSWVATFVIWYHISNYCWIILWG